MNTLGSLALLLLCQTAGEALRLSLGLPLPGSILGLMILLGWLALRPKDRLELAAVSAWLTAHLSVLFIPAAVGIMQQAEVFTRYGLGLLAALIGSTLLTMIVTAVVFRRVARWAEARKGVAA